MSPNTLTEAQAIALTEAGNPYRLDARIEKGILQHIEIWFHDGCDREMNTCKCLGLKQDVSLRTFDRSLVPAHVVRPEPVRSLSTETFVIPEMPAVAVDEAPGADVTPIEIAIAEIAVNDETGLDPFSEESYELELASKLEAESVSVEVKLDDFRTVAMRAAARGESRVLPILVGGKNPLISWKDSPFDLASREEWAGLSQEWIDSQAAKFPNVNCAVVAKQNEHLFIDEDDSKKFRKGYEAFSGEPFPRTFTTSARANRCQSHWKQTDATREMGNVSQLEMFSVRQHNLYVLSEGSQHKNGVDYYRVIDGSPIIAMPDKLVEYIQSLRERELGPSGKQTVRRDAQNQIPHGRIHDALVSETGSLCRRGYSVAAREEALVLWATENCAAPVDFEHVRQVARSTGDWKQGNPADGVYFNASAAETVKTSKSRTAHVPLTNGGRLVTRRASDITTKKILWIWDQRVPLGKLTIFSGNPDQGKSLITMYMVSNLTSGRPLFGSTIQMEPCDVLLMAGEDEADDTIVPRLQAGDADLNKVHIVESVASGNDAETPTEVREAHLDVDIKVIEEMLLANPSIKLVIIDPLSNYLGQANMNKEQEVRSVLVPLKNLAARTGVAVVCVMHLNKSSDASAIHRIGGAVAFVGVARAAWLFTEDSEDKARHLMLRVKGNIAKTLGGLAYAIQAKTVTVEGEPSSQPYVEWLGETEKVASDVLIGGVPAGRPPEKEQEAKEWLLDFLADGAQTATDVESFGRKAGHSFRTLTRAKKELDIGSTQQERRWVWVLPSNNAIGPEELVMSINLDKEWIQGTGSA
jgi:putative DNA primase/helicase